jgi:hypothetical protein
VAPGTTYVLESFFGDDRATARYVTRRAFSPATAGVYVVELGGGDSWLRVTEMAVEGPNAAANASTTVVKLARGTKLPAGILTASFTAHRLRAEAPSTNRWTSGQWLVFACGESTSSCVNVHDESAVVPVHPTASVLLCGVAAGLPAKATAVNGEPPAAGGEQAEPCLVTFDYGQRLKASVVDKLDRGRWRIELRSVIAMDGPTLVVPLPVELQLDEAEFTLQLDGRGALSVALGTNNSITATDGVLIPDYGALLLSSSVTVTLSVPRTADEGGRGSDGLSFQRVSLVAVKTRGNMMDPDICRIATASAENFVHVTPNSGAIIAGKHSAVLKVPSLETFVLDESATHDVIFALCVGPVSGEDGQLRGIAWPVGFAAAPELLPRGPVNPTAILLARPLHLSTPHCPLIHVHGDAHASASLPPVSNSQRSINVCTAHVAMVPCVVASDGSGVRPDPGQSTVIWQPLFGAFAARLPAGETLLTLPPFGQASRAAAAAVTSAEEAHGFYALVLRLDRLLTAGSSSSSTVPQYAPLMGCTPLYGQGPTVAHAEGRAAQGRADIAVGARTHMLTVVDAAARGEDGGNDDNNDPTQDVEAGGVRFTLSSPVILARGIDARWFPWRPDSLSSAAAGTVAAVTASELRSYVMNGNLPMRYGVEARVVSVAKHSDLASDFRAVGIDGPGVLIVVTGTGGGRAADGISVVTIAGVAAVWHDPLLRAFHVAVAATVAHPFRVHAAHLVQRDASCKAPPVDSQYSLYETPPESLLDLRPASRWLPSAVANANATGTRSTNFADATLSATFFQVRFHANPISDLEVRLCITWHVEKTAATPPSDHAAAVVKAKRRGSAAAMVAVTKPLTPKTAAPFLITAHADVVSATMDRLGTRGFFTFTSNVHDPPPNSIDGTALTLAHTINTDAVGRHNIRNPRIGVLPWDADGFAAETLTIPHGTNYCPPVGPRRARRVLPVLRMHSKFALYRGGKSAASTWLFVGSTPGVYCLYFSRHGVSLNAGYVTAPGPLHPLPPVAMRMDSATGAIVVNAGIATDLAVIRAKAIPAPVGASALTRNWSPDFYLVPTDAAKGRAEAARCDGPTLTSAVARVVDVTPETAGELASERATMSTTTESIVRVRVQAVTPGMYAVCLHRSHNNELQKALADVVAVPTTHRGLSANHTVAFDTRPLSSKFFGLVLAEVPSAVLNALRAAQFTLASDFVVKIVGTFASEAFPAAGDSMSVAPYGLGHAEIVGVDRSDDHHSGGTVTSTIAATLASKLVGRVVASKKATHGSHQLHATEILIAFTATTPSSAALDRICTKAPEQQTTDGNPRLVLRFRSAGPTWHRDGNGTLVQDAASPVVLTMPLDCPAAPAYHASREEARSADASPDTVEGEGDLDEVVGPTGTPPVTQPHSFAPSTATPVYSTVQTGPTITVPVLGEPVFSDENVQAALITLVLCLFALGLWRTLVKTKKQRGGGNRVTGKTVVPEPQGHGALNNSGKQTTKKKEPASKPSAAKSQSKKPLSIAAKLAAPPPVVETKPAAPRRNNKQRSASATAAATLQPVLPTMASGAKRLRRRTANAVTDSTASAAVVVDTLELERPEVSSAASVAAERDEGDARDTDEPADAGAEPRELTSSSSDGEIAPPAAPASSSPGVVDGAAALSATEAEWTDGGFTSAPDVTFVKPEPQQLQQRSPNAVQSGVIHETYDAGATEMRDATVADDTSPSFAHSRTVNVVEYARGAAAFPMPAAAADSRYLASEMAAEFADGLFDLLHCDLASMMAGGAFLSPTAVTRDLGGVHQLLTITRRDLPAMISTAATYTGHVAMLCEALRLMRVGVLVAPSRPGTAKVAWFFDPPRIDLFSDPNSTATASGDEDDATSLIRLRVLKHESTTAGGPVRPQPRMPRRTDAFAKVEAPPRCPACDVFLGVLCCCGAEMPRALWATKPVLAQMWTGVLLPLPNWLESVVTLGTYADPAWGEGGHAELTSFARRGDGGGGGGPGRGPAATIGRRKWTARSIALLVISSLLATPRGVDSPRCTPWRNERVGMDTCMCYEPLCQCCPRAVFI